MEVIMAPKLTTTLLFLALLGIFAVTACLAKPLPQPQGLAMAHEAAAAAPTRQLLHAPRSPKTCPRTFPGKNSHKSAKTVTRAQRLQEHQETLYCNEVALRRMEGSRLSSYAPFDSGTVT
jgi:hypothetical protein